MINNLGFIWYDLRSSSSSCQALPNDHQRKGSAEEAGWNHKIALWLLASPHKFGTNYNNKTEPLLIGVLLASQPREFPFSKSTIALLPPHLLLIQSICCS